METLDDSFTHVLTINLDKLLCWFSRLKSPLVKIQISKSTKYKISDRKENHYLQKSKDNDGMVEWFRKYRVMVDKQEVGCNGNVFLRGIL